MKTNSIHIKKADGISFSPDPDELEEEWVPQEAW